MTEHRTSAGDPARTLALLWRTAEEPPRGPRRGLRIDGVVDAAIALADADGLDAVTMRRLAGQLDVSPMTLYTYVRGKAELLDLMLDTVYGRMPGTDTAGRPWRERLTSLADANRALYLAHPWAAQVATLRPPLGPGLIAKYERELAAFDGVGLSDVETDGALTYLLGFVRANARDAIDAGAAARDSASDDEQWWRANAPLLEQVLDPATYPRAVRIGGAAGAAQASAHDPHHAYRFGLSRVLDGLAALIETPLRPKDSAR